MVLTKDTWLWKWKLLYLNPDQRCEIVCRKSVSVTVMALGLNVVLKVKPTQRGDWKQNMTDSHGSYKRHRNTLIVGFLTDWVSCSIQLAVVECTWILNNIEFVLKGYNPILFPFINIFFLTSDWPVKVIFLPRELPRYPNCPFTRFWSTFTYSSMFPVILCIISIHLNLGVPLRLL